MSFKEGEIIEGYDKFQSAIKILEQDKSKQPLFILFTGSDGPDGKSWCPDCIAFEGMWEKLRKNFTPEVGYFIRVKVGPMNLWRHTQCPFRTDKVLRLQSIPTLVQWKSAKRLSNDQIKNPQNIRMLMEN